CIAIFCAISSLEQAQEVTKAAAQLASKSGSQVTGTETFTKVGDEVQVVADVQNLKPSKHGIHIHEKGDCSAPDAMSAGAHFNPASNPHAGPLDKARHNGDLGNIAIGQEGKGQLEIVDDLVTVKPGPTSVVGKSVIFHEQIDDLKTQPAGNSGARLGCGVIR